MGTGTLDRAVQTFLQLSIICVGVTFCILLAKHMARRDEIHAIQEVHERTRRQAGDNTLSGGAVYIRWGRNDCPTTNTELVYKGFAAGNHYSHSGGGSNYVCLTDDPVWGTYSDANDDYGRIYGAEYQTHKTYDDNPNFPFTNTQTNLENHDVPCAVCASRTRPAKVMIPGTNVCATGWTKEYQGYLVSNRYSHPAGHEYVCMDDNPIPSDCGRKEDKNGALFYPVEAECGALPCGPYVQNREITCVVCTRAFET